MVDAEREDSLPADLLHAITHQGGGRVVLVVGAGVSVESPTKLPLAGQCAEEAHRRLVEDGILAEDACDAPDDLSAVADAVFDATGSQVEVVRRLPRERFVTAVPNKGHCLAAALLRERALASVLTLNFDMALSTALVEVGASTDVSQIRGPENHDQLGAHNLVYLHRTAQHSEDEWILRTQTLAEEWEDNWEEAITTRVMTTPVVVFAGLGSPAAVLTETITRLRAILGPTVRVLQVDVVDRDESVFADHLGLGDGDYIQSGWVEFMRRLANRVLVEQLQRVRLACADLCQAHGWPQEDIEGLCETIAQDGLLLLGRLRARWMIEDQPYLPEQGCDPNHVADLALAIRTIERESNTAARLSDDGVVEFWDGTQLRAAIAFASARGVWRWGAIEPRVERARQGWDRRQVEPRKVIVGGAVGAREDVSPPESILAGTAEANIIEPSVIEYVPIDTLRTGATLVEELLSV